MSSARRSNIAEVAAGTTLGTVPPRVTMPLTIWPGSRCWRARPMATWATVIASAAFTPRWGAAAACEGLPV